MNQKIEKLGDFKKTDKKLKMNLKPQNKLLYLKYDTDKSILVTLNGRVTKCTDEFKSLLQENYLKSKLEDIYKDVDNFDRVEIKEIENIK